MTLEKPGSRTWNIGDSAEKKRKAAAGKEYGTIVQNRTSYGNTTLSLRTSCEDASRSCPKNLYAGFRPYSQRLPRLFSRRGLLCAGRRRKSIVDRKESYRVLCACCGAAPSPPVRGWSGGNRRTNGNGRGGSCLSVVFGRRVRSVRSFTVSGCRRGGGSAPDS